MCKVLSIDVKNRAADKQILSGASCLVRCVEMKGKSGLRVRIGGRKRRRRSYQSVNTRISMICAVEDSDR